MVSSVRSLSPALFQRLQNPFRVRSRIQERAIFANIARRHQVVRRLGVRHRKHAMRRIVLRNAINFVDLKGPVQTYFFKLQHSLSDLADMLAKEIPKKVLRLATERIYKIGDYVKSRFLQGQIDQRVRGVLRRITSFVFGIKHPGVEKSPAAVKYTTVYGPPTVAQWREQGRIVRSLVNTPQVSLTVPVETKAVPATYHIHELHSLLKSSPSQKVKSILKFKEVPALRDLPPNSIGIIRIPRAKVPLYESLRKQLHRGIPYSPEGPTLPGKAKVSAAGASQHLFEMQKTAIAKSVAQKEARRQPVPKRPILRTEKVMDIHGNRVIVGYDLLSGKAIPKRKSTELPHIIPPKSPSPVSQVPLHLASERTPSAKVRSASLEELAAANPQHAKWLIKHGFISPRNFDPETGRRLTPDVAKGLSGLKSLKKRKRGSVKIYEGSAAVEAYNRAKRKS